MTYTQQELPFNPEDMHYNPMQRINTTDIGEQLNRIEIILNYIKAKLDDTTRAASIK